MVWIVRQGAYLLALLLVGLVPAAASAQSIPVERVCHASASATETWHDLARTPARWRCDDGGWSLSSEAVLIRFDLGAGDGAVLPQSISTHTGYFERIDVGIVDRSGRTRWASWGPDDLQHIASGPYMSLDLVGVDSNSAQIVVRVIRPWSKTMLSEMTLDPAPHGTGWPMGRIVAMAAICGMLLVPLFINTAFYSALPERYVLWHLLMVAAMLVQAAFATGFVHLIVEPGLMTEWQLSNMAFAVMAGAALMFATTFLEPDKSDPRLRRAGRSLAPVIVLVGALSCVPAELLRPLSAPAMHIAVGATIGVIAAIIIDAWRRGSRVVRFQIIGWTPIMVSGTYRIAAYLIPSLHPTEAIVLYQLALAFEVLVTALGIVSRFVDVRQERDDATARAIELEGVADRDPLTGLRNRRSIEGRFDDLFLRGFRTMAVMDLDLFKHVNDTHGHAVGDTVLRAAARALIDDRDTKAIRMGGEEFILLLRGPGSVARAECCRRAISTRVAAEVPGLDRLVTASMGLVEHDTGGTLQIEFATLYARCDRLLYEAKRLGRNRTMKERVTGFDVHGRAVA
ncbi:diguanylate cyclase (GGDEF)-like protein [Novosphingobium hassiacum]|uniref:diguanylate cyclase n=1 Tax=Novosphingobium hassiacum TaxID=173676 RepID=A0A7W6EVC7_9SPHN|nr:diguanylate cyclase [Novosphingobium hassiacum]MBB3860162.1 diguanylate cyclase (GGDEF)-like protein [Novosphingobium hassiacum]